MTTQTSTQEEWLAINQSVLATALDLVRIQLARHADRVAGSATNGSRQETAAAAQTASKKLRNLRGNLSYGKSTIEILATVFGLSTFELDTLLLCAGVELDAAFSGACAAAQGDSQRGYVTFGLALAALESAHWSAVAPSGPLRYWRLIEFVQAGGASSAPITTRPLRIDERILNFLIGIPHVDERITALVELLAPPMDLLSSHQALAKRIAGTLSKLQTRVHPAVLLFGTDTTSARQIAASACSELNLAPYLLSVAVLPSNMSELDLVARLWEREAALSRCMLIVEMDDRHGEGSSNTNTLVQTFLARLRTSIILISPERVQIKHRQIIPLEITKPTVTEIRAAFLQSFAEQLSHSSSGTDALLVGQIDKLASQFTLSAATIRQTVTQALEQYQPGEKNFYDCLWDVCREQSRVKLGELAQFVEARATWHDLVLPEEQTEILRDVVAHVKQQTKVYETWGFAAKSTRGLGISAMFAGVSGTGKTLAAEVLAHELRLDLFRIDLSSVVSKYIGETEKNLRRLFDAAEEGGAILFFDEADALFGKRSEVKDSHDRYANIEVSYLLQRMENYRGLAILTTNMKSALDFAFLRRIRFIVQFPFPDFAQRVEIWRRVYPAKTPTEALDFQKLSQLNVSGGNIRNIALNAAFIAAESNEVVQMRHILRAARAEYAKLERSLTSVEIQGWEQ